MIHKMNNTQEMIHKNNFAIKTNRMKFDATATQGQGVTQAKPRYQLTLPLILSGIIQLFHPLYQHFTRIVNYPSILYPLSYSSHLSIEASKDFGTISLGAIGSTSLYYYYIKVVPPSFALLINLFCNLTPFCSHVRTPRRYLPPAQNESLHQKSHWIQDVVFMMLNRFMFFPTSVFM